MKDIRLHEAMTRANQNDLRPGERATDLWRELLMKYYACVVAFMEKRKEQTYHQASRGIVLKRKGMMRSFPSGGQAAKFLKVTQPTIANKAKVAGVCRGWQVQYADEAFRSAA